MRFFGLLDFQHMVLAFFLGLVAVIVAAIAWGAYPRRDEEEEPEVGAEKLFFEDHGAGGFRPVPPLLVFIYVAVASWVLGYVIIEGIFGGPIG